MLENGWLTSDLGRPELSGLACYTAAPPCGGKNPVQDEPGKRVNFITNFKNVIKIQFKI